MSGSSTLYRRFAALLLPAVLLWSWVACVSVCAEITEQNPETKAAFTTDICGENDSRVSSLADCQFTATPATFQDRQTFNAPALMIAEVSFPSVYNRVIVPSVNRSDINQHSPPKLTVPVFLRLRNFRI